MQKTEEGEFLGKVGNHEPMSKGTFENLWITVGGNQRLGMHSQSEDGE